jgi:hypothetical protein
MTANAEIRRAVATLWGPTGERSDDPSLGQIFSDVLTGELLRCTTQRSGSTPAVWTPFSSKSANAIINGGCVVKQRANATLSTSLQYGGVDRFKVGVTSGTTSAGTITRTTTSVAGRTGYALHVSGASMASTPTLTVDYYIEALEAINLRNATAQAALSVWHDVGSTISYTVSVDKATAPDNFAAVTNIATSAAQPVASGVATDLTLPGIAMGDCSNGIRVRVTVQPGTTTTKNFHYTEWWLGEITDFPYAPFAVELVKCGRYFQKSFPYAQAPAQFLGSVGARASYQLVGASVAIGFIEWQPFLVRMRIAPTLTTYNPSANNALVRNLTRNVDTTANVAATAEWGFNVGFTTTAGSAVGDANAVHWTVDADF